MRWWLSILKNWKTNNFDSVHTSNNQDSTEIFTSAKFTKEWQILGHLASIVWTRVKIGGILISKDGEKDG